MKTFKKSIAIILSILMLVSVMAVAGVSASATTDSTDTTVETLEATTESVEATTESVEATTESVEATTESVEATTESVEATTESVEATTESVEATTESVETTTETAEATTESVEATTTSVEVATTTEVVTESVETTTEAPVVGTFHVVAGAPELCNGANWNPADESNRMTETSDGVYEITYTNVAAGTYSFKVTTGGAWDNADYNLTGDAKFGGPNADITVTEDGSTVKVTFAEADGFAKAYINDVQVVVETATTSTDATEATTLPAEGTFHVVAGVPELCNGVSWDPADASNRMTETSTGVYEITYTNVPAGTYQFKVTTGGAWDIGDYNFDGDAKFGGANAEITVGEDGSTVKVTFAEADGFAKAFVNDVQVSGVVYVTDPTATETEPTTACEHKNTTTKTTKATYFAKGKKVTTCKDCGTVISTETIAKKVLKTPSVTVKGTKKAIKVTLKKKVTGATGIIVTYKVGKTTKTKTFKNAKGTYTIKKLKKGSYKVNVRSYVKSGKKTAKSKATKTKAIKVTK
jgi:hypothetical protein